MLSSKGLIMRIVQVGSLTCVCVLVAASAALALPAKVVESAKRATALVEIPLADQQKGFGSAFCIDASGVFVTNAHVADAAKGGQIRLILSPGEADQKIVDAKVLKSEKTLDLALLKIEVAPADALPVLPLGDAASLYDTMELTAFGYPFGEALSLNSTEYPAVSVSTGRVTSLRKKAGALEIVQVDAVLNPGNSGGPMLDADGHVMGIVQAGVQGAGINFAIPVSRLQKMLLSPVIHVGLSAPILYALRDQSHHIGVTVVSMAKPLPKYDVELSVRVGKGNWRSFHGAVENGMSNFDVVPAPGEAAVKIVAITAKFPDGVITGHAVDQPINVGDQKKMLSDLRQINHLDRPQPDVTGREGNQTPAALFGLGAIRMSFGEMTTTLDLTKATSISIEDVDHPARSLQYKVAVKVNDEVVGQDVGSFKFEGAPGADGLSTELPPGVVDLLANDPLPDHSPATMSPIAGWRHDREPWVEQSTDNRDMVGVRYESGDWANKPIFRKLEPIFDRDAATGPGVCMAKPGYVVGGMLVDSDDQEHAVRLIFMKSNDGRLDPDTLYLSDWINEPVSGLPPKLIGGHGEHVVGLCGYRGLNLDGVGLILTVP